MPKTLIAKVFKNGASQAIRLPADFRFKGTEVYATRDERTGDVVLSSLAGTKTWGDFFKLVHSVKDTKNFMAKRPMNVPPRERNLFAETGE